MKKRVLEVFTFHGGYMGGIASMVASYLKHEDLFNQKGYQLVHLNAESKFKTGISKFDNFCFIFTQRRAIKQYLRKDHIDLVHIHTSREFLFLKDILLAKMIKKYNSIPIVLTIHVGDIGTVYNRIAWFKRRSIAILNNYVDKTVFLSQKMCQQFVQHGLIIAKSTVLYNFHDFTQCSYVQDHDSILKMLFVGALHQEKGIIELLSALNRLPELNYHLSICGSFTDANNHNRIEKLISQLGEKVSYLGYVHGADKTKLFLNSDLLILPSYHEGLPLVIMEALGAGCAIMSTKVGAIPEILSDDNCFWVEIGSDDSIVYQFEHITRERINMMKQINGQLGSRYSFSAHAEKLISIYNESIRY